MLYCVVANRRQLNLYIYIMGGGVFSIKKGVGGGRLKDEQAACNLLCDATNKREGKNGRGEQLQGASRKAVGRTE